MFDRLRGQFEDQLSEIRRAGLYKQERFLSSPQNARVDLPGTKNILNLCANNYLGLADHPEIVKAANLALERWGYGLSSVRFICGTQEIHKELESRLSQFLGMEETILYGSCFDANGGLFETLLDAQDCVISDELNHASIIDGIRLSKAQRLRYRNGDMGDLEAKLKEASAVRRILIATDGVFSMDGYVAKLSDICDLAERYGAMVMVDDSHAVGFMGENGRGTHEHHRVMGRVDILTGTLGKALGGASGGYTSARREIVDLLRQRSRPYLFSNSVAPVIVGASLHVLYMIEKAKDLRERLHTNTRLFREKMSAAGFDIPAGEHPIVPVMLGKASLATRFADKLLERGIYVIGFSYPVVPQGKARIRVQISAAHTGEDLEFAVEQFAAVRDELQIG
jgi:glycine C-acetyltransferase